MNKKTSENLIIPTYNDVLTAHERIKPYIYETPVLTSSYLNQLVGAELFLNVRTCKKRARLKYVEQRMPCLD